MSFGSVEYAIKPWKHNHAVDGSAPHGYALVMPGTGYTCDRPLLYWSAQMLAQTGWHVDLLNVHNTKDDLSEVTPVIETAIDEWHAAAQAQAQAQAQAADAGLLQPRMLLIGKSLTTLAYGHARKLGIPMALFTPVLNPAPFDPSGQRIAVPSREEDAGAGVETARKPLICAGSADPYYDADRAHALSEDVHEFPGANHSIEVPGDWQRSLEYLSGTVAALARYAAAL